MVGFESDAYLAMACIDAMTPDYNREQRRASLSHNLAWRNTPGTAEVVPPEMIESMANVKAIEEILGETLPGYKPKLSFEYDSTLAD